MCAPTSARLGRLELVEGGEVPAAGAGVIGDPGLGGATREQYAVDVLHGLGAPITPSNVAAIEIWIGHESGGRTGFAFNPLNTTDHPFGSAGQGGSQGNIQYFQNYDQGVKTVVHQLQYPNHGYPAIVAALRANAGTAAVLRAVNASAWGTHNFSAAELGGNVAGAPVTASPGAGGSFSAQPAGFFDSVPGASILSGLGSLALQGAGGLGGLIIGGDPNKSLPGKATKKAAGAVTSFTGGVEAAIEALGAMAGGVVELFANWKYVLEFLIGVGMVLLGVRLISADLSGGKVIPRPDAGNVAKVAAAAA